MNDKIIFLLDIDGVVVKPRHKYFSQKLSEEQNIPIEDIMPFFKGEYVKAATGQANIEEILLKYLINWQWKGTLEEFLAYWFKGEQDLDLQLLEYIDNIRKQGFKCYLVSDNERNRAKYLMEKLKLKDLFDGAFFSVDLGVIKSNCTFFNKVIEHLKTPPTKIYYWDDDIKNIESANSVGINGTVYSNLDDLIKRTNSLINK